ncbi:peroxidase superfamily protein [Wolffia australiana]
MSIFRLLVHPSLRAEYDKMSAGLKIIFLAVHGTDRLGLWHRLPAILGAIYLALRRSLHDKLNLLPVGKTETAIPNPVAHPFRSSDGTFTDLSKPQAGSENAFFGRNAPPVDQSDKLFDPDPFVVASKLLERRSFVGTGKQFNVIAASWIQFMVHDWIDHLESTRQVELVAPEAVAGGCPLKAFRFYATENVDTSADSSAIPVGHKNIRTAWWDGSVIYGTNKGVQGRVRTGVDGKLSIGEDGLLQRDEEGRALSGDIRNSWAGVSVLQALFVKEHNAVCDALKKEHPEFDDEMLFQHARLVTSAVIAKIHTIDWTVELLKTDTLNVAMHSNWYGILGKTFKSIFGHIGGATLGSVLSGLVGLKAPNDHGVPYSLTEEFTSVYRMHPLLPDTLQVRNINAPPGPNKAPSLLKEVKMEELIGIKGEKALIELGFERQLISMGHQACGSLELWNYPSFLRDLVVHNVDGSERPDRVDLPTLEVYRDRERSNARYNQFRRSLLMIPISRWEDLTDNEEAIKTLREVYGDDVEKLDLLVGLMAEKKIKGFAISETAFFIFVIMASRRLQGDRFFTSHFNEKTYTKKGLEWVNNTESFKDVINRHYPDLATKWINSTSGFSVWDAPPEKPSWVPLYLRIPN